MEQWYIKNKKADFHGISRELGISEIMARLLVNRDLKDKEAYRRYIEADLSDLHEPVLMKDIEKAAKILYRKIKEHEKIRIIGDYDVDGVMSVCILYIGLKRCKAAVDYEIPDRIKDGYGLNMDIVKEAMKDQINTILTCDNGIGALEQVRHAKEAGMTVIITDHHDIAYDETKEGKQYHVPDADAVVNPKQPMCRYPCKQICGAVVAWKLIQVLYKLFGIEEGADRDLLDFAAIATVCDVMDLVDENRIIVKYGLEAVEHTSHIGLRALIEAAGLDKKQITVDHLGFILGPCINASGRLKSAKLSISMLLAKEKEKADEIASRLTELNQMRKSMTNKGLEEAVQRIEGDGLSHDSVLVVYLPSCHESLAGIIAGRLKERYEKPAIVLTKGEKEVKGSGRSIEAYPMFEKLNECRELLSKFGGHPMAAGLSLKEENIEKLRGMLNEKSGLTENDFIKKVTFDMVLPFPFADENLIYEISRLKPFGNGNPRPLFALKDVQLLRANVLGTGRNVIRLSMKMNGDNRVYQGIMFQKSEIFEEFLNKKYGNHACMDLYEGKLSGCAIDIIYYPEINEYRDTKNIQMVIEHYR